MLYTTFIFSFTELTTAIPHAGGPFAYSRRAFGPLGGLIAGYATLVEFVRAAGDRLRAGWLRPLHAAGGARAAVAIDAYFVFVGVNIIGIRQTALFELFVTVLAVVERWCSSASSRRPSPRQLRSPTTGVRPRRDLAAIPFAIWFYLAIEGVAMAAEEAKGPTRTIPRAYIFGILTLVFLALDVMILSGGVGDWRLLSNVDYPLPEAMAMGVGRDSGWTHMLVAIGLFGLVTSFHGIIIGYSRQMFALARAGYLPSFLATVHPRFAHTALGADRGRRDRHHRHSVRADGGADHHVGFRRSRALHHQHGGTVQAAGDRARPGAAVSGAVLPAVPGDHAVPVARIFLVMFWFNQEIGLIFIGMFAVAFVWFAMTGNAEAAAR